LKFGVGVEGPSDAAFWTKVLHRGFPHCQFYVRNMKTREKLIRETPILYETFKDLHYDAGFVILDRDSDPCSTHILNLFEDSIQNAIRVNPFQERFLLVFIAVKELESWYLADDQAIRTVLNGHQYTALMDTSSTSKSTLKQLIKSARGKNAGFNELGFAKEIAPRFNPQRAAACSPSFKHFWDRVSAYCSQD
jgi:Domain of unknown function (DUF4276)